MIVGRAQLLLARTDDAETARSLRIMINQAGRAHRILRDLMFVGRPPAAGCGRAARPSCCATSVRDFQEECTAGESGSRARSTRPFRRPGPTPTPCAISPISSSATPSRPRRPAVRSRSARACRKTSFSGGSATPAEDWIPAEAAHLFDPFYCGRQAGRGLGLGLPRAARIVAMAGGRLRWTSNPGQGTVFHINLPLPAPQEQPRINRHPASRPTRNGDRPSKGEPAHDNSSRHPGRPTSSCQNSLVTSA